VKVAVFVGTRPEIIKMAALLRALRERPEVSLKLVHTGQHSSWKMSTRFIEDLDIPAPDEYLSMHAEHQADQVARTVSLASECMRRMQPDVVLVEGDTNSVAGVAFASVATGVPLGHVEAGCRSFDLRMPEEINRILVSDCAQLNFAPTETCAFNLLREGFSTNSVFLTGHPIVDTIETLASQIERSRVVRRHGCSAGNYLLLTVHRQENADDRGRLRNILKAVSRLGLPVIFPVHPRTRKRMREFNLKSCLPHIIKTSPVSYPDALSLVKNAHMVLTDSGGLQQEAAILGTPCLTLRENTEWLETVEAGINRLTRLGVRDIVASYHKVERDYTAIREKAQQVGSSLYGRNPTQKIVRAITRTVPSLKSKGKVRRESPEQALIRIRKRTDTFHLHEFLDWINMIFDEQGRPICLWRTSHLMPGYRMVAFGPSSVLDRIKAVVA
jgi:UDP-N-acetylglucosamine 2-epimerase